MVGRLKSGLYNYVDDHFYFANHVIKLRFDMLDSKKRTHDFTEDHLFDNYLNIFDLEDMGKILSNSPISSHSSHKFVYIITNSRELKPHKIMITPHLHEKRIYLNRIKPNTEYFYTAVPPCKNHKDFEQDQNVIVCVNLSESKYYSYCLSGILR